MKSEYCLIMNQAERDFLLHFLEEKIESVNEDEAIMAEQMALRIDEPWLKSVEKSGEVDYSADDIYAGDIHDDED